MPRLPRMRRPPRSLPARSDSGALAGHRPPESVIALQRRNPNSPLRSATARFAVISASVIAKHVRRLCPPPAAAQAASLAPLFPAKSGGVRIMPGKGNLWPQARPTGHRSLFSSPCSCHLGCWPLPPGAMPVQWNGEGNGYGYDGDRHREERREMRREQEAEEVQRERWAGALGRTALGAPRLIAWRPRRRKGDRRSIAAIGRRIGCAGAPRSGNGPKSVSCR